LEERLDRTNERRDVEVEETYLRMSLEDLKSTRSMRLFGHDPEEVGLLQTVHSRVLVLLLLVLECSLGSELA